MLTSQKVIELLSVEDITRLVVSLGSDDPGYDNQGNLMFSTSVCHGGDSHKLYFFPSSKMFHCFTHCGSMDLFELVRRAKDLPDFISAFKYVVEFFKLVDDGFEETPKIDDWDILKRVDNLNKRNARKEKKELPAINSDILEYYTLAAPEEWLKENISIETMQRYNIRVDSANHSIIIPHYDVDGRLVGIRRRTYDPIEIERGKYSPLFLEGDMYNHPLGDCLYGLYQNKDIIKLSKRAIIFEAEKSVLQLSSYVGLDNCIAVATCGSSISQNQIQLLIDLGVEEVTLAYDREFEGGRGAEDTVEYEKKLSKIMQPLLAYMSVYVIMDYDHLTEYKDSPTDRGYEVFKKLLKQRIKVTSDNNNV